MERGRVRRSLGVIGGGECDGEIYEIARKVGAAIAARGFLLVCGGLGGTMEGACRGAKEAGGVTLGILPGTAKEDANPFVDIAVPTGLGHARNVLVVHASEALIAIDGGAGTLSEIALGLKTGKPVVGIRTWSLPGQVVTMDDGEAAVVWAVGRIGR